MSPRWLAKASCLRSKTSACSSATHPCWNNTVGADQAANELATECKTPMIVAVDDAVIGVIAVADQIRADAPEMVARLHDAGVEKVVMLTGDTRLVAEAIGKATGIDEIHA